MAETLTTTLRLELDKTNQQFARWSSQHSDWLRHQKQDYSRVMEECDYTIQALRVTDHQLEEAREVHMAIKQQQLQEMQAIQKENDSFKRQITGLETQLRHYEQEEEQSKQRLMAVRQEHDALRQKMEQNLQDLTHGLRFYTRLGLDFQKADGDAMKFIFTQIDPASPTRAFSFVMFIDEGNNYQLVETSPTLPVLTTAQLLKQLNTHNDIASFVFHIRKMFCAICK
jgi:hypothetical protein